MFDFRYNCGDANCYQDLARLRGIKYMTWEDLAKLKPEDEVQYILLGSFVVMFYVLYFQSLVLSLITALLLTKIQ